jgi:hypothetical protein
MSTSKRKEKKLKKLISEKNEAKTAFIQKPDKEFKSLLDALKPDSEEDVPVKKKAKKKRADKYDPKLKVKGEFIDLINAAVAPKKNSPKKK